MFTGIVEEVGTFQSRRGQRMTIAAQKVREDAQEGDSIAINGACLTVVALGKGVFSVDVMPETLRLTNLGQLRRGNGVNLERAVAVGQRLGGHFVQGHVEATGKIVSFTPEKEAVIARFWAPPQIMRYVVTKGFIAVDGISLTVVERNADYFTVSLVSYTQEHTILAQKKPGDLVNLETDILAKYVEQLLKGEGTGLTWEGLTRQGFIPQPS
ncbi:MAG: riboflavin synthase [Chloroflexi bacterium]|nr:riboflavin synthase [Chloroflexota bacterium]